MTMSALPRHVALVSRSKTIDFSHISAVAAALNKQVVRDFGPSWNITATVDSFQDLKHVPVDYWPVVVLDKLSDPTAGGYHQTKNGEPFSVVLASEFPLAASHETLEMLADPFGRRTVAGSPPPNSPAPVNGFTRVAYFVEVCDPCEADNFSYTINGVPVSDFITPQYYDPSFRPALTTVLRVRSNSRTRCSRVAISASPTRQPVSGTRFSFRMGRRRF